MVSYKRVSYCRWKKKNTPEHWTHKEHESESVPIAVTMVAGPYLTVFEPLSYYISRWKMGKICEKSTLLSNTQDMLLAFMSDHIIIILCAMHIYRKTCEAYAKKMDAEDKETGPLYAVMMKILKQYVDGS